MTHHDDRPLLSEEGAALLQRVLLMDDADINTVHRILINADTDRRRQRFQQFATITPRPACSAAVTDCADVALSLSFNDQGLLRAALQKRREAMQREHMQQALDEADATRRRIQARHPEQFEGEAGKHKRKPSKKLTTLLKPRELV